MKTSTPVSATVISISPDGTVPVIELFDLTGQAHRFTPNSSSSWVRYEVGQPLQARVESTGSITAKIDSGFHLWDTTLLFSGLTLVFGVMGELTRSGKIVWGPLKEKRLWIGP
ncbi:MAG: hypothetical protein V4739_15760 [Pseudomonadota bacterium]